MRLLVIFLMLGALCHGDAIDDLQPGHWYEVPNSHLDALDAAKDPLINANYPGSAPWRGTTGFSAIMAGWSGGTYDRTHHRLLVWGGGHADYAGNEIYGFDMNSLTWARLSNPSADVGGDATTFLYPDGNPRALHSHKYIEFVPSLDRFMIFSGVGPYPISYTGQKVFGYDFSAKKWEVGVYPDVPSGIARGANALYDTKTGNVWYHGGDVSHLCQFNTATKQWTTYAPTKSLEIYGSAAIDPNRRLMVLVGGYGGTRQFVAWDLNNPNTPATIPASSGDNALETSSAAGFDFDTLSRLFVGWKGGADVYTLNPDTWKWTKVSPAAGNTVIPTAPTTTGTFGRFRYVPSRNAFVVVNNTNENVFVYRLNAGTSLDRASKISKKPAGISAAPNPFHGSTLLSVNGLAPSHVVIYDACGKQVASLDGKPHARQGDNHGFQWDASNLPAGVYVIKAEAKGKTIQSRIIHLK